MQKIYNNKIILNSILFITLIFSYLKGIRYEFGDFYYHHFLSYSMTYECGYLKRIFLGNLLYPLNQLFSEKIVFQTLSYIALFAFLGLSYSLCFIKKRHNIGLFFSSSLLFMSSQFIIITSGLIGD